MTTQLTENQLAKLDRAKRAVSAYENLVDYWTSNHRVECSSVRLNQTKEFIQNRATTCTRGLSQWRARLDLVEMELNINQKESEY